MSSDSDVNWSREAKSILNSLLDEENIRKKVTKIHDQTKSALETIDNKLIEKVVSFIDLTRLNNVDITSDIEELCNTAKNPLGNNVVSTAAVCVYPTFLKTVKECIGKEAIEIASVGGCFPTAQTPLSVKLAEIQYIIDNGATEIDIVINRSLFLEEKWDETLNEIRQIKKKCVNSKRNIKLKTIICASELKSIENVYKATILAISGGSDFVKTSTGKEASNVTLEQGIAMVTAIKSMSTFNKSKVGFKAAGGIKTYEDALTWMFLVQNELGDEWLTKDYFRIGASSLLDDLKEIYV